MGRTLTMLKNKSMFQKIVLCYIGILVVPLCTSFISFYTSKHLIEQEIRVSNHANLKLGIQEYDTQFNDMSRTLFKAAFSTEFLTCLSQEKGVDTYNNYKEFKLHNYMNALMEDYIADIFVYFHNSDRIVSASYASFRSEVFYSTYYYSDNQSYLEWVESFLVGQGSTYMYLQNSKPTIALTLNYPITKGNELATMVIVLNPTVINKSLHDFSTEGKGDFLIFNKDNQLLVSSGDYTEFMNMDTYDLDQEYFTDILNNKKYTFQVVKSLNNGFKYVYAVSSRVFWEKLKGLLIIHYVCFFLFFVCSSVVITILSRKTYKPLGSLVSELIKQTNIRYNKITNTETDYLNHVFAIAMQEKEILSHKMEEERLQLIDDIFLRALQGNIGLELDFFKVLETNNVFVLSSEFIVTLFKAESWDANKISNISSDESQDSIHYSIMNTINDIFPAEHSCFVVKEDRRNFICVISVDKSLEDFDRFTEKFDMARIMFEKTIGVSFTISVSETIDNADNLHVGYSQAHKSMEYRSAFGRNITIYYKEIKNRVFSYHNSNIVHEQRIIDYIKNGKKKLSASKLINDIVESTMQEDMASLEAFKCFRLELTGIMANVMKKICSPLFISEHPFVDQLIACETFLDFKMYLIEILDELLEYEKEHQEENDLGKQVMDYILENYADPDLNINMLGDAFSMSPSYLSKLFKTRNGMSPLDFLVKIRINKSKELIEHSQFGVEEIAMQIGFLSSSVFIRAFKKIEGITPGVYKKVVVDKSNS